MDQDQKTEVPHGSSIADHRDTPFELKRIEVFGHGRGGVSVHGIDRDTRENGAPLELTSEMLMTTEFGDLNPALIDLVTKLEHVYAATHAEKAAATTTAAVRARILAAKDAEQRRAEAEQQRVKQEDAAAKAKAAADAKAKELAELEEQIAARRAELEAANAPSKKQ